MRSSVQENRFQIKQHTILTWVTLTVEILVTALSFAILNTLGVSGKNSILITFFVALLIVCLGLLFIYKVYPKITQKPSVKVSLFEDYVTLANKKNEREERTYLEWLEHVWYKSAPFSECYTSSFFDLVSSNWVSGHLTPLSRQGSTTIQNHVKLVYEDIEGKHITIEIDNQNKKMTLYILSKLTSEVKGNQVFAIEQKQEQIELIDQITKEAFKPQPNGTLLRALINGLISVFRGSPGMDKAVDEASSLTNLLGNLQG